MQYNKPRKFNKLIMSSATIMLSLAITLIAGTNKKAQINDERNMVLNRRLLCGFLIRLLPALHNQPK